MARRMQADSGKTADRSAQVKVFLGVVAGLIASQDGSAYRPSWQGNTTEHR
jgi:hypothetical protein